MRRILGAVGVSVAVCLMTATGACAAPTVGSVGFSPARVMSGATVTAGGKVANRGSRATTVTVRLGLRADGRTQTIGLTRVRARAHNKTPFRVSAVLPGSLQAGTYAVVACVGRTCRTAGGDLVVAPPPRTTPTAPQQAPSNDPLPPAPTPPAASPPPASNPTLFPPGARTGGDRLFAQIGNGGYDAQHYDLQLSYDAGDGSLTGEATMHAVATQNLGQFSMDFQGMTVDRVRINGINVTYSRQLPAQASANAGGIASKLVIDPPSGILDGSPFAVTVDYHGVPDTVVDPDNSEEGWIPTQTGGAVLCQPIGCQAVYPQNNIPTDKATFDTSITVPAGMTGIGNGELVSSSTSGANTTWRWKIREPISTYLTTATVGDYALTQTADGQGRPIYNFVDQAANGPDPAFTPGQLAIWDANVALQQDMVDFMTNLYGPYPFDSYGAVAVNAPSTGYALEVASKPFYVDAGDPVEYHAHELLHQWWGDSLTYGQIQDIWVQEGMAQWMEWYWDEQKEGGPSVHDEFLAVYNNPLKNWTILPGRPAADQLFATPIYERGAMTHEALREIIGDTDFFRFVKAFYERYQYGSISTAQYIALAEQISGRDLTQFFQDYLFTAARPPLPSTYV